MIKLHDASILDLLPQTMHKSPDMIAFSHAVQWGFCKMLDFCKSASPYAALDQVKEEVLDALAADLRTPYYDKELSIFKKRELVKNTISWYMRAGTPGAVEELIEIVFGMGKLEEWFEYGGEPYTFKISTPETMTQERLDEFCTVIKNIKNARSILSGFDKIHDKKKEIYTAIAVSITKEITILREEEN